MEILVKKKKEKEKETEERNWSIVASYFLTAVRKMGEESFVSVLFWTHFVAEYGKRLVHC